jgi:hypothetical protein
MDLYFMLEEFDMTTAKYKKIKNPPDRKVYHSPLLIPQGHITRVTQKTGFEPDQNHPDRPKHGVGEG